MRFRREPAEELLGEFDGNRFGAVEDQAHRRQVVVLERLVAECLEAVAVAEVRRARDGDAPGGRPLEPEQGAAHEQVGGHQVLPDAGVHHHEVEADQAHVVRERHPAERDVLFAETRRLRRTLRVRQDVAVGEHHALGFAGRTRRELDERSLVGVQGCGCARPRNVVERVDQERARLERTPGFGLAEGGGIRCEAVAQLPVGVEERLAELLRDAQQLVLVLVADPDGDRHRHDAAVKAGPVRVDELLVARNVQDQVVARLGADTLQVKQDAERAPPQVRKLECLLGTFTLEVNDRAVAARAVIEHVRERLVLDHRCCILM